PPAVRVPAGRRGAAGDRGGAARLRSHRQSQEQEPRAPQVRGAEARLGRLSRRVRAGAGRAARGGPGPRRDRRRRGDDPGATAADLPAIHAELDDAGIGKGGARTIVDVTACPGADTCNLAVTQSRELAAALTDKLEGEGGSALAAAAESLDIKISGCPNSCGQ